VFKGGVVMASGGRALWKPVLRGFGVALAVGAGILILG
jgi:hypothetical protein